MLQHWLWLLRLPTQWPDSLLSYPPLPWLLRCGCRAEQTAWGHIWFSVNWGWGGGAVLLTPCLESLSTCQRWCWQPHLRVASSMQCRLCRDHDNVTHQTFTHTILLKSWQPLTLLAAVEGAGQVCIDHGFPAFSRHVLRRAAKLTSSVVDQKVYSSKLLQHRWHKGLHLPHHNENIRIPFGCNRMHAWTFSGHLHTSSSLRMLHGSGVTLAELDAEIFCLISSAAASNRSAFRLEITTLQPEDKWFSTI